MVKAIAVSGGIVYVGGNFTAINGVAVGHIAALNEVTGALVPTFTHSVAGEARALAIGNGRLYAGGTFTAADGVARNRLAAYNLATGALDATWHPSANQRVNFLWFANNQVYLAGCSRRSTAPPTSGCARSTRRPAP